MSAVEEGGGRRGNTQGDRSTGQQRQNQNQSAMRENSNNQNRKGGKNGQGALQNNKNNDTAATPTTSAPDEHVPLHGFNSSDVDALLKKTVDLKVQIYKSEAQSQQTKQSPWGAKRYMANGRDFFLELRKQVTALQQSGGVSQGG